MVHLLTTNGDEAFALATELAGATGESLGDAMVTAVRPRLDQERRRRREPAMLLQITHAFAKSAAEPRLFKRQDFTQTDATPALA